MQSSNRKSVSETVCCVSNPSVVSDCSATGEAGDVLRNRRDQRRGLSVAGLARSSGFPGKSPEVYATSATTFA
jgi:hypothetical protein